MAQPTLDIGKGQGTSAVRFQSLIEKANKIAILVPNFSSYSGNGRVADIQAEDLAKKGKKVAVFTLQAGMKSQSASVHILGMPTNRMLARFYELFFPLDVIKVIKWLLILKGYDLIISHFYPMNWLAYLAKKLYKIKYIYWYHGIVTPANLLPYLYERLAIRLDIVTTKLTTGNVDLAVSVSKSAAKELKGYTGIDSDVIYNQPDLRKFQKGLDSASLREKYKLGNSPVILNVGIICPQKGTHLLLQAFALVKREIPQVKLIIVGKHNFPYYTRQLGKLIDDAVIVTGFVPDESLPYYYRIADIYATCSLWETYNLPVLEAQASGKPVIAFDFDFFREEVNNNGILVEKRNLAKFAGACIRKIKEVRPDLTSP